METDENIGKRILLVEDERVARELMRDLLKQNDHVVVEANNGAEAYSLFTKGKFDLVMTDYIMPFVNGDELATRIKQVAPMQPILMVTAHEFKRRASSPVNSVLQKPFDSFLLQQEIDKLT